MTARKASSFEIASSLRSTFARLATQGMTASPEAIGQIVMCLDELLEGLGRANRTAAEIAEEILNEVTLVTEQDARTARASMEAVRAVADELSRGDLEPIRQQQLAMRLRAVSMSLRGISDRGPPDTVSIPLRGKVS